MQAHDETEAEFLARYRPGDWPKPSVGVDLVVFTEVEGERAVLLIRRAAHPYRGRLALPGGFLDVGDGVRDQGEDLPVAAARELHEETSVVVEPDALTQVGAFGRPGRDPRMRCISVAYTITLSPELAATVQAGDDAAEAAFVTLADLRAAGEALAFDHDEILAAALATAAR